MKKLIGRNIYVFFLMMLINPAFAETGLDTPITVRFDSVKLRDVLVELETQAGGPCFAYVIGTIDVDQKSDFRGYRRKVWRCAIPLVGPAGDKISHPERHSCYAGACCSNLRARL